MYIFSKDGDRFVNSENVKYYEVESVGVDETYYIEADGICLGTYDVKNDAIKALNDIFRQLELGVATSYQLK